jgi:hypothetical protein
VPAVPTVPDMPDVPAIPAKPTKRTQKSTPNAPLKITRQRQARTALNNKMRQYVIEAQAVTSLHEFLEYSKNETMEILQDNMVELNSIKVNLKLEATYTNVDAEVSHRAFKTKNRPILESDNIMDWLNEEYSKMIKEADESQQKKSGWTLASVNKLLINVHKYSPMRGSSYIPLPEWIIKKKACINVHNNDSMCFKYAILTKFVEDQKHASRVWLYNNLQHRYDFNCISYPPSFDEVKKFGNINNVSINIFGLEKDKFYPLLICKTELEDHRDLLLLDDGEKKHFIWIKNFERLVKSQITNHKERIEICRRCFTHFTGKTAK